MLSPQQKRWLAPPVSPSTDGKENNKGGSVVEARSPPNGRASPVNENEMWRRLKKVGLDEETLQKKDKAALIAHITKLETEIYDYQYNMGLILLERKELISKYEQLKLTAGEAEGNFKCNQAAHLAAIAEADKREESLRKALGIEKQCVADLEKALHEMRAESAEIKFVSETKLAKAHELMASTEEKSLTAESRLHAGEALQAEANRKRADAERLLQDVEAREDELRRQRQSFKSEREAHEKELFFERQNLREWEKNLQEGQERLLDGQRLLNQREEYVIERNEATKQIEEELQDLKRNIEKEQSTLKEKEADLRGRLADLTTCQEALVKQEVIINKKEQELLLLQEKLATREREEIQRLTDEHQAALEERKSLFEEEMKQQRKAVDDELENKRNAADVREFEIQCREEKISKREQQVEKKAEKLKEKGKELDARLRDVKEREKSRKIKEKEIETLLKKLEIERDEMSISKQVLEKSKAALEEERQQIRKEQERLELTEKERDDLRIIQIKLKEEIDNFRQQEQELSKKDEVLTVEKEKFEREWEILDEKTEQLRKELEKVDDEKKRISKWLKNEEERLKQEKRRLREQIKNEEEALCLEKESFANSKKQEEAELLANFLRERADLYRDIELQKSELEKSIEQRQEELERNYQVRDLVFRKEKQKEMQYINAQKELSNKESQEMKLERQRLDREKQEIVRTREHIDREWSEMKKDIEEMEIRREKLKELRESLHKEREEFEAQLDQLKKLKDELKMTEDSLKLSEQPPSQAIVNDYEVISPGHFDGGISQAACRQSISGIPFNADGFCSETHLTRSTASASDTPSPLAWLQKCTSRIFKKSPGGGTDPAPTGLKQCLTPVANLTESQPSCSGINKHEGNTKGSLRVFKRTRSVRTVVDEVKRIFEVTSEREKSESDNVNQFQQNTTVNLAEGNHAMLNSEKEVQAHAVSAQDIDEEREKSLDNSKKDLHLGRKRRREYISQDTIEKNTEDVEIQSEPTSGEQRKKQREIPNCSPGLDRSNGKRYNFRDSTMASKIATRTSSTEGKDKGISHGEENNFTNSTENCLKEVSKEPEEKETMLSHENGDNLKKSQQTLQEEFRAEFQEDYSCELTRVLSVNEIDKETSSPLEVILSETGELCAESDGNNDMGGISQDIVVTEQEDEEEDEPKSFKEKVWDFLTT
ncbi:hypothetical protein SUGI_0532370 [Cryptomeria japonica]|uniref:protein CROWDED NUCLEI 4 n=1 Tax=Cryptomeria japonica TaxID=3369 RepID=UPI002408EB41|nr:protein CROWDED NUCLEI 4 [Cryptomeria japonica]GLJ27154.1 hypothetical protein SUGI_0532370 [Cryptomeria japonica]